MAKAYSSFDMDAFMKGRKLGAGTKAYSSFAMEEGPDRFKATAGKRDKDRDGVPADRIARDDRGNLIYNSEAKIGRAHV